VTIWGGCAWVGLARIIYTVFWQENHQIYGHIRCVYCTFLKSPRVNIIFCPPDWCRHRKIYIYS
jgi:hypothetical protein